MAKRAIGAVLILAVLLMAPSCSLEEFLKGLSANVLGPNAENTDAAVAVVDSIKPTTVDDDEAVKNLLEGLGMTDSVNASTSILPSLDESGVTDLASTISSAAKTPQAQEALNAAMAEAATDDVAEGTKGTANLINQVVNNSKDEGSGDIPSEGTGDANVDAVLDMFNSLIEGVEKAADTDNPIQITKADAAIMQTTLSFITIATNKEKGFLQMVDGELQPADGIDMNQAINDNYELIANTVFVVDTLGPASNAFKDVDLNLDTIIAAAQSGTV